MSFVVQWLSTSFDETNNVLYPTLHNEARGFLVRFEVYMYINLLCHLSETRPEQNTQNHTGRTHTIQHNPT